MNGIKTVFFMAILIGVLMFFGALFGGRGGMEIALLIGIGTNFFSYFFSDKIVLSMYGAREVNETTAPELYSITKELTRRAEIPMPKVYIIDENTPNAFATGRNPNHAAVAVTTGILRILDRDELSGVIAHELGHIKNRDILISTIVASIAAAIGYLAYIAKWGAILGGGRNSDNENNGNPLGLLIMAIIAPIAALIIQMAISRAREYKADEAGAKFSGNPDFLASALLKLEKGNEIIPMEDAKPATAHMFIVNPLHGDIFRSLFSTHPKIEDRVRKLREMRRKGY